MPSAPAPDPSRRLRLAAAATGLLRRARGEEPPPPHHRPAPPRAHRAQPGLLRVASYNIHKCVGTDGRFDPHRIIAVIGELDADLVALQEADRRFGRRSALLDPQALERATGLVPVPASLLPDGLGWHGNALLVRPGTQARLNRLALPGAEPRGAVVAELGLPGHGALRVVAAHLGLLGRCRRRQAAHILSAIAEGAEMPTLLLGDLNEWLPARRSSLRVLEPMFGPAPKGPFSFPSRLPILSLDRILGWPAGIVRDLHAHESPLARIASDHLPLTATVQLSAAARAEAA